MGLYTGVALDNVTINSGKATFNTLTVTGAAPVTKTASFTVGANDRFIVCNGTASITVTLPAASSSTGRVITIKTIAAYTVVSASSNVAPANSATAGTAILAASAGAWAELVSDGTSWIVMAS